MNLLGLNIQFNKNGKYVKQQECHQAQEQLQNFLDQRFESLESKTDTRFCDLSKRLDDLRDSIMMCVNLVSKK